MSNSTKPRYFAVQRTPLSWELHWEEESGYTGIIAIQIHSKTNDEAFVQRFVEAIAEGLTNGTIQIED